VVPSIGELRPALELAWAVAKAGTLARPPIRPPARLRPLMRLNTLPERSLMTVRQALEEDADFRGRVVEWAGEANLDGAAWLWLVDPPAGQKDLGPTAPGANGHTSPFQEEKDGLRADRHLTNAEPAGAGTEAELFLLRQVNAAPVEELTVERQARRHAEPFDDDTEVARRQPDPEPPSAHGIRGQAEVDGDGVEMSRRTGDEDQALLQEAVRVLEGRVSSLVTDLDDTVEHVTQASQQLDTARDEIAQLTDQLEEARTEAARLQVERDATEAACRQAEADRDGAEVARRAADEERARLAEAVGVLEGRVSSLLTDLDDTSEQVIQGSQQVDTTRDQVARLSEELEEARTEAARLQDERDATEAACRQAEADRDGAEVARRAADEERGRLGETVRALEGRVSSLLTDLGDTSEQVIQGSEQVDTTRDEIARLTEQLEEARAEAARWQVERDIIEAGRGQAEADREGADVARQTADEERARLAEAVRVLEARVSSLAIDLDERAARLNEASQERDEACDQVALLTEQLQQASAESVRLLAGRDEIRSAAGRGIARAAEAARLLSETLAEVASTDGEVQIRGERAGALERWVGGPQPTPGELGLTEPSVAGERFGDFSRSEPGDQTWPEPSLGSEWMGEGDRRSDGHRSRRVEARLASRAWQDEDRFSRPGRHEEKRQSSAVRPAEGHLVNTPEASAASVNQPRHTTRRRRPLPLPPAVFYDSFEAADHLVRVPGVLVIVDGHNVTSLSSPDLELSRQRHQLVDGLAELSKGAGPQVHVVFDRADLSGWFEPPAPNRSQMRVTFSPEGTPPDQIIRDLIDQLHPAQALVVATSDRQLQEWVRRCGGNVVSVPQVLAVVSRASAVARPGTSGRFRRRKG
jgi:predicted RNA-binding protein with PIN domain/uncharacterized coiled-coil DUF342 family protein